MNEKRHKCIMFFNKNKTILIGLLCIILCTISPLLSYLLYLKNAKPDGCLGIFGDWIGGTTAPFIGVLGAILVARSFHEQVKANKLLKDEKNRVVFFKRYDEISKLIQETNTIIKSFPGISAWDASLIKRYRYFLSLIDSNFQLLANFTDDADTNRGRKELQKNGEDSFSFKNLLRDRLMHFYEMEYEKLIDTLLTTMPPFENIRDIIEKLKQLQNNKEVSQFENNSTNIEDPRENLKSKITEIERKIENLYFSDSENDIYPILMSIKNIIEVIILKDSDFWGEKQTTI